MACRRHPFWCSEFLQAPSLTWTEVSPTSCSQHGARGTAGPEGCCICSGGHGTMRILSLGELKNCLPWSPSAFLCSGLGARQGGMGLVFTCSQGSLHILFAAEMQSTFEPRTWLGSALWWVSVQPFCLWSQAPPAGGSNWWLCPEPWELETFPHLFAYPGAGGNRQNLPTWARAGKQRGILELLAPSGHMTNLWSSLILSHSLWCPALSLFITLQVGQIRFVRVDQKAYQTKAEAGVWKPPPCWKLSRIRLTVRLRLTSHTTCVFSPGALSLFLSSHSGLEPLEVSGNQSPKQTIQRAMDLGGKKFRDVTPWSEQWPFYARAHEPPFRRTQRFPLSGVLEAVPMHL